jgi:hypothetical protein
MPVGGPALVFGRADKQRGRRAVKRVLEGVWRRTGLWEKMDWEEGDGGVWRRIGRW